MTRKTQAVLSALLAEPDKELYGLEIYERTGLMPGTTYPILVRLQHAGLVRSRWEDADPTDPRRPRRRYYQLADLGIGAAPTMAVEATGPLVLLRRWLTWTPQPAVQVATSGTSAR
ncbi:PadR family transcriptional regulator [Prauserella sp. PE36]|uniref:Transcriptional regulator PadR-like family protein n=1 Tax=Amycolatopsis marina TaxID=490629 RepID=A0A1I1BIH9_9PSEU|nr:MULTISPECIES: helix-turn-helix transcriptional regulator [Pseudonocardiaceae]RBM18651.1 PadR family transcriptional regulator [Prauserella sp. PE36]SFB49446.1 Transcriptional regulator PadR-like family protein [Amycolatopsis marina]